MGAEGGWREKKRGESETCVRHVTGNTLESGEEDGCAITIVMIMVLIVLIITITI